MIQLDVFFSYACRDTYKVFKWLHNIEQQGTQLDITWRPFAVEIEGEQEWQQPWETARSELRGFMAAEAAREQGQHALQRFHRFLEEAVHEDYLELGDESTLIQAAVSAELDIQQFQSVLHSRHLAQAAYQSHQRGMNQLNVFGTPTLVFVNNYTLYLELTNIPPVESALQLFQAVNILAVDHQDVVQLKRTH